MEIFGNKATDKKKKKKSMSKIYNRGTQYPTKKQLDLNMGGRPK